MAADKETSGQGRPQKRLEELLLDESDGTPTRGLNCAQEGKVVGVRRGSYFILLMVLIVVLLFVLGIGFIYLKSPANYQPIGAQHHYFTSKKIPIPVRSETVGSNIVVVETAAVSTNMKPAETETREKTMTEPTQPPLSLFSVSVGPFISDDEVTQAVSQLQELGFQPEKTQGRGMVMMIRLLEGTYSPAVARRHLQKLKNNVKSAFLLPQGNKLSVFAGSFHQEKRAAKLRDELAAKNIDVTLVDGHVEMSGTKLVVLQADRKTAQEVADHLSELGLKTGIIENK